MSMSPASKPEAQDRFPERSSVKLMSTRFSDAISNGVCSACNGYYGPAHGQSVCATCHAFLYANDLDAEVNVQLASVERDGEHSDSDHDSGNDEPNDFFYRGGAGANNVERQYSREDQPGGQGLEPHVPPIYKAFVGPPRPPQPKMGSAHHHLLPVRVESLSQRLAQLAIPRVEGDNMPENIVDALPPEVLMVIFSFLDDISLFAVGNVCRRWHQLLTSQTTPEHW